MALYQTGKEGSSRSDPALPPLCDSLADRGSTAQVSVTLTRSVVMREVYVRSPPPGARNPAVCNAVSIAVFNVAAGAAKWTAHTDATASIAASRCP